MYNGRHYSFHEAMLFLVQEFGVEVLTEPRLEGLMADVLGGEYTFFPVMHRAVQTRVGQRIIELAQSSSDCGLKIDNLKQSFQEENFLNPQAASYLIDSYAYALGLVEEVEQNFTNEDLTHEGEPIFVEVNEGEFCGYRNQDNERCGFGILKESDGCYYAGEWNLDMRMGVGIGFSTTRRKYAGQWRINKQHGIGMELQDDGTIYSGQWKNGMRNGIGTIYFPNGESLSSVFIDDHIADCVGIWHLQDKSFVQGKMTMNGPTGLCFHTLHDGTIIEEYWNNGKIIIKD